MENGINPTINTLALPPPPTLEEFPKGVPLWTDHNRRFKYLLNPTIGRRPPLRYQRGINLYKNITFFKLERTSLIAHEQTQVYEPKPKKHYGFRKENQNNYTRMG